MPPLATAFPDLGQLGSGIKTEQPETVKTTTNEDSNSEE